MGFGFAVSETFSISEKNLHDKHLVQFGPSLFIITVEVVLVLC